MNIEQYLWPLTTLAIFLGMTVLNWRSLSIAHDLATLALQRGLIESGATPGSAPAPKPAVTPPAPVPAPAPPPDPSPELTAYDKKWEAMQILPQHQATVDKDAAEVLKNKATYETVSTPTGVPWYVIGLIDQMEAGGGCDSHLHNGDPLKGRTIHVPAGRPPPPENPPFTWQQSALDALAYEGFDKIKDWSISGIAGALEKYNGMGYHNKGVPSPYLWSFSNQYTSGKYVADHVYDPNAVSQQAGAMTILKALMAQDSTVKPIGA